MILLYADPREVKYVETTYKMYIGLGAKYINEKKVKEILMALSPVILFGSSGLVQDYHCCWKRYLEKVSYNEFIIPISWNGIKVDGKCCAGFTSNHSVKEQWEREWLPGDVLVVDQESAIVAKICQDIGVTFTSVRYIIDRCDRKCMPMGVNHFWRKYQHRKMQLKFNKYLEEI